MSRIARITFAHRADLLAALVYGCLAYLSFSALAGYTNAHTLPNGHPLFPNPWGGYALAVAVDGSVLYAFISFKRAPWLAGILLVSGAAATYTLQRWHAQGALHPLMVAGVVPFFMVLVTFAWHRIREATVRPDLEALTIQQAELDAKVETERALLEERLEHARMVAQVSNARHRAFTLGAPVVDFGLGDWKELLAQHDNACAYCGARDVRLTIEHRIPLYRGGEHTKANIVPACEPCNSSKSTRTEEEWLARKGRVPLLENQPEPIRPPVVTLDPAKVEELLSQGMSASAIQRELGLSKRKYLGELLPMVRELKARTNGHGSGS